MHPADADTLPPTRRPLRRRAASVRAVRVQVTQLDWLHRPVVWWGGPPPETARPAPNADPAPDAVTVLAARLRTRPPGAFAVHLAPSEPALSGSTGVDALLASAAPKLLDLTPVDEPLVARSLRRLARLPRQFPRVLPNVVGDVAAWHAAAGAALERVHPLLPPRKPTPAERLAIESAAVWLAPDEARPSRTLDHPTLLALACDAGVPQVARAAAVALGRRKLAPKNLPPRLRAWNRCGKMLPGWPLDVIALAAEAAGPAGLCDFVSRDPRLAGPRAAHYLREALLVGGVEGARRALAGHAPLDALIERLCDEPRARLGRLAAAQRDAVERAVALSGVHGPVVPPAGGAGGAERWVALRLFQYAYDDTVEAVASGRPVPRKAKSRRAAAPPPDRRFAQFHHLLGARRLWEHFLGDGPPVPAFLGSRIHWLLKDRTVDFESAPALAAKLVWDAGEAALRGLADPLRGRLWALAARLDSDTGSDADWRAAASAWVEACCATVRPGVTADAHAEAAFVGLFALGGSARSMAALASAAAPLTRHWPAMKGTADAWNSARALLVRRLKFIRAAAAAGLDAGVIETAVRRGWTHEIEAVLSRRPDRLAAALRWLRRLGVDDPPNHLRHAFVLLDADVVDALVAAGAARRKRRDLLINWAISFVVGGVAAYHLEKGALDKSFPARLAFVRAVPAVLASLPSFVPNDDEGDHRMPRWSHAAAVAFAWFALGYPDPAAVFDATSAREPGPLLQHVGAERLPGLVSLSLGRLDRLLALNEVRHGLDYQELGLLAAAWRWLEPLGEWRELLSRLAQGVFSGARPVKLLVRLGLCLRLHRGPELRRRLEPMLAGRDPPPHLAAALEGLGIPGDLRQDLRRLCALQQGVVPRSVEAALTRPAALAAELHALESRPAPGADGATDRRRRRADNLRRYLGDPAALCDWVVTDLRKVLPPAVGKAALDAAERLADEIILSHATAVVGLPPPAGSDTRNWDNALRLYFTIDQNRGALRKLLRGEARGDRSWIVEHPANRKFLAAVAARGVDVAAWRGTFEETFATPAGDWTVSLETDPLHVLQMGNYFETCLALDGCNAFATVANACEADKRVAYVRDARGVVVGRKLLLLTPGGRIVGFRSYGAGALDAWADDGDAAGNANADGGAAPWVKIVLDVFSRQLADRCRARLHPLAAGGKPPKDDPDAIERGLFCRWYNDGPEPFDPPWLRYSPQRLRREVIRGGPARERLITLLRGHAAEVSAARRVLTWLGEDGAAVAP